ncbi:MAG TPA: phosphotransferase [Pirellulales bacterium]
MPQLPQSVAEISAPWLDEILHQAGAITHSHVVAVESKIIGEGIGYLSSVARVKLTYDRPEENGNSGVAVNSAANTRPATVIVKIEPPNEDFRRLGEEFHAFEREIRFYREVASQVPVRLPKIYYTLDEPPDYAIVMEDLGFCTAGDQLAGMQERQVTTAARMMGTVQAKFWNNTALHKLSWMPDTWDLWKHFNDHWPSFVEHCRNWLGPEHLLLGRRVAAHFDWIMQQMADAPPTIVHCDLREDNLLFGPVGTPEEVLIVDWQLSIRGMGAYDIASLQGGSELATARRGHPFQVLRSWHEMLVAGGVENYSYDEALRHFRIGNLVCLTLPVYFHMAVLDGKLPRGKLLCEAQARRHFGAALEIDAASVLPE